jgi:hypothetical protein
VALRHILRLTVVSPDRCHRLVPRVLTTVRSRWQSGSAPQNYSTRFPKHQQKENLSTCTRANGSHVITVNRTTLQNLESIFVRSEHPLRYTDPDGHDAQDPCGDNPNCVTATAPYPGLSPLDELLYRSFFNNLNTALQIGQQTQQIAQQTFDWLSRPRNATCLAASTAAGASAGVAVGMAGVVGGPAVAVTEPTAMAIGGGAGWVGGMISCMSSSGSGQGGGGGGRKWKWGSHKSSQKAANQMSQRGWTNTQIDEAIDHGARYPAPNNINPANGATRYVNPTTGRSVVIDNVTKEVLHVGGDGFRY